MFRKQYDPFGSQYESELTRARMLEKRALFINTSKLGALLLIYTVLQYVLLRIFYIVAASIHSGTLYIMPSDAIAYLRQHQEFIRSTTFSMAGNLSIVVLSVTVLLLIARFAMKIHIGDLLHPKAEHVGQALKWMPMCLVINIVISIIIGFIEDYLSAFGIAVPDGDFTIVKPTTLALILQFLYIIVIGPVAEELIYRGIILTLLRPFGKYMAVFFSALIFGIMHGNIPQAASAFGSAMVMGVIAVSCGSIVPTIIIHILNNIVASYDTFADVLKWPYADEIYMGIQIMIYFIGFFVMSVYGWQLLKKDERKYALTRGQTYSTVFTNVFMIIYFIYCIYDIVAAFIRIN